MRVGIFGKEGREDVNSAMIKLQAEIEKSGKEVVLFSDYDAIKGIDVLIVLGGDGKVLHTACATANRGFPIVAVNYGTLGFLTEFERGEEDSLIRLLDEYEKGKCKVLNRTLLEIERNGKRFYALNEVSFLRDFLEENTKMLRLQVDVDGETGDEWNGDGALVCTPTGSTAYSLSAGGAILSPKSSVFMLNPICAFSLNARPIVVPDDSTISVQTLSGSAVLLLDGKPFGKINTGEEIILKKAPFTANFLLRHDSQFFRKLWKKLK